MLATAARGGAPAGQHACCCLRLLDCLAWLSILPSAESCSSRLPLSQQYLVTGEKWESLDPLVRSRLLLAPLFMRKRDLAELRPALAKLAAAGAADKCVLLGLSWLGSPDSMCLLLARWGCWAGHLLAALLSSQPTYADPPLPTLLTLPVVAPRDEWVRAMAQSVGDYDGRLHNDRLLAVRQPRATQHAAHSKPSRRQCSSAHAWQEPLLGCLSVCHITMICP